ncbi:hypothetical protein [Undibacterium sp.]|uniref:hypothetical protein n=1 Tax=Undibacterium sp. TaxID=1914977 RepID=UPI003751469F
MREGYAKQIQNIEQLEMLEEKFGVNLVGLNAIFDNRSSLNGIPGASVEVFGEIHAVNGGVLGENIEIIGTAFDVNGKVIGTEKQSVDIENFFAISPIKFYFFLTEMEEPAKLRIYPAKRPW